MKNSIEQWLYDHNEDINFWCFATVIGAIVYGVIVGIHTLLAKFLGFTNLWMVLVLWLGVATGRVAAVLWDERQSNKRDDLV